MGALSDYQTFLARKSQIGQQAGFEPVWMPDFLKDFQAFLAGWSIRRGRAAAFAGCGMGKTPVYYVWAENVVRHTNKPVLVATSLGDTDQSLREAAKFQVEAVRSKDGKFKPGARIVVTNYERLHHFNPCDFAGAVGNECFPAGTKVEVLLPCNSLAWKYIEDIVPGDQILNASGVDRVQACAKRPVRGVVVLQVGRRSITCSDNHPFLTVHGWKCARDLRAGDYLVETETAMRLVRDGVCPEVSGEQDGTFLRNVLLSEMADEPSRTQSQGSHERNACQDRPEGIGLAARRERGSKTASRAGADNESHSAVRSEDEGDEGEEQHLARLASKSRRQRDRAYGTGSDAHRCSRSGLGALRSSHDGEEGGRVSVPLPDRLREHQLENCHRGGRTLSPEPQGSGQEEGRETGFARVESVEVLQPGDPRLESLRDADGALRFYDLEAKRHPSFSVEGILVHNSGILKNFKGKTKATVTEFFRTLPYRLLCTATPSPNDYIELGTSSEALGELGYQDMLTRFFVKKLADRGTIGWGREQFRMKGHAERDFWRWICSWARACRKPSDLGFDDSEFILPPLICNQHIVSTRAKRPGWLFDAPAITMDEQREELRRTLNERCEKAAELVAGHDTSVSWCYLNPEGNLLTKLIPGAVQVSGTDSDDEKEEKLNAFACGQIKKLVSKPKITGHGLNWQHCAHMTFFPSNSWEQWHQCVRRCWRFKQTRKVEVDVIATPGISDVLERLQIKEGKVGRMFSRMIEHMNDGMRVERSNEQANNVEVPSWLPC